MNHNYQESMSIIGPHSLDGPNPTKGPGGQGVTFSSTSTTEQPAKSETPEEFGARLTNAFSQLTVKTVDPAYREALKKSVSAWQESLKNQKTA